jgi:exosortase
MTVNEAPLLTNEQARSLPGAPVRPIQFWIAIVAIATIALFYPVIIRLVQDWWSDPDYSYGFLIPLFGAYVLRRKVTRKHLSPQPSNMGMILLLFGIFVLFAGTLSAELFLSRISLLISIAGLILFLAGRQILRLVLFPLSYLVLMIPLPAILYNQIVLPLQFLASRVAETCLRIVAIPVLREGNILVIPNCSLEVAQACSGFRSLMSLMAVAIAIAYITERRLGRRLFLVGLMLPIAVLINSLRVFSVALLAYNFGPQWAEGSVHSFSGWLITMLGLFFFLGLCTVWQRIRTANRAL